MKKEFWYTRMSNRGNPYDEFFTVEVSHNGFVTIVAEFSLQEVLHSCLYELTQFVGDSMSKYMLGIAEFPNRVNHGHPASSINNRATYYVVDGKAYRCDKHLNGAWTAPVSDLFRILVALKNGENDDHGLWL